MSTPTRARAPRVRPFFAGVVIEGAPNGGTLEQAQQLVAERLARHILRVTPPVFSGAGEAAD